MAREQLEVTLSVLNVERITARTTVETRMSPGGEIPLSPSEARALSVRKDARRMPPRFEMEYLDDKWRLPELKSIRRGMRFARAATFMAGNVGGQLSSTMHFGSGVLSQVMAGAGPAAIAVFVATFLSQKLKEFREETERLEQEHRRRIREMGEESFQSLLTEFRKTFDEEQAERELNVKVRLQALEQSPLWGLHQALNR